MNIDALYTMWEEDCEIDDDNLDRASVKTPNLHAKYLKILVSFKMKLSALEHEYKLLRQRKFRYYRGEMPKSELESYGWEQWQGVKPLKNEMEEFLDGDSDLNAINVKCQYTKNMIEAVDAIMNQLKARDWQIRNAIEWRKFVAGS
jgi:hypothetical protein